METNKKLVRKLFLPHQYEKEEEFLMAMARNGWHFVSIKPSFASAVYEFIKGEPKNYSYQLDYVTKDENTEDYHQLFQDAGWEEVSKSNGIYNGSWYYFRKENKANKSNKIFTDTESKYSMYSKLLKHWGLYGIFITVMAINSSVQLIFNGAIYREGFGIVAIILVSLCSIGVLFYIYMIIMIFKEMNKWKKLKF